MTAKLYRNGLVALLILMTGCAIFYNIAEVLALPYLNHTLWPLNDGDDWLRMAQVRDWIGGASFYDHTVRHTNAPTGGVSIHWTRPMDMLLALVAVLLPASFTLSQKVMIAACIIPPLLGVLMFCTLFCAARRAGAHRNSIFLLAFMALFDNSLQFHFLPGSADHHALQSVLWGLVLAYCSRRSKIIDALLAGLFLSLSLWVSVEGLLLIASVYALFGLYAVIKPARIRHFAVLCFSTFFFSLIALLIEIPPARIFNSLRYDTISIVHIALLSFIALAVTPLITLFPRLKTTPKRLSTAIVAFTVVCIAMFLLFPDFFQGPMAGISGPDLNTYLLSKASEAQPLFKSSLKNILWILPLPLIAGMTLIPYIRRRKFRWNDGAFFLLFIAATTLINIQIRWFYYMQPVAVVIILCRLPVVMRLYAPCLPAFLRSFTPMQRAVTVTFAVILFCLGICKTIPTPPRTPATSCKGEITYLLQTGSVEDALKTSHGTLYIHPRFGGLAHYFTSADMIAAGYYHREVPALKDLQLIATAPDLADARPLLKKRHVTALLICPALYPADSWLHALGHENTPLPNGIHRKAMKKYLLRHEKPRLFILMP